jgi:hypothetical protein
MTCKAKSTRWEAANRKHTMGAMRAYPWDWQRRKSRCDGIAEQRLLAALALQTEMNANGHLG